MTTKIQKWGNSLAVRLPRDITRELHLREGSEVAVEKQQNRITIISVPPRDRTLRKEAWRMFLLPTKKKKENVSGRVDEILYGVHR